MTDKLLTSCKSDCPQCHIHVGPKALFLINSGYVATCPHCSLKLMRFKKVYPWWLVLIMLWPFIICLLLSRAFNSLSVFSFLSFSITYFICTGIKALSPASYLMQMDQTLRRKFKRESVISLLT